MLRFMYIQIYNIYISIIYKIFRVSNTLEFYFIILNQLNLYEYNTFMAHIQYHFLVHEKLFSNIFRKKSGLG